MKKIYYIIAAVVFIAMALTTVFTINGQPYFVLCDDEMISMFYARTLFAGVEGFTNPLWTLIMIPCQLLPRNIASLPIILLNLGCIIGMMRLSKNPLFLGLTFPIIFWAVRGVEFIPIAFLLFYGIKTRKIIIPIILITLLRADGFVFAGILILASFSDTEEKICGYRERVFGILALGITLLAMLGIRYLYYGEIFPNTYYLKMGYPLSERLSRGIKFLPLALVLTPAKYIIPVLGVAAYSVFIGGDAWEQYRILNRFLILTVPFLFEMTEWKELAIVKTFYQLKAK